MSAPVSVWRALLTVPAFVARRAVGLAGSAVGRGPSEWERTHREVMPDGEDALRGDQALAGVEAGMVP